MSINWAAEFVLLLIFISLSKGDNIKINHGHNQKSTWFNSFSRSPSLYSEALRHPTYQNLMYIAFAKSGNNAFDTHTVKAEKIQKFMMSEMLKNYPLRTDVLTNLELRDKYDIMELPDSCLADLNMSIIAAEDRQLWALEMLDATGKPGPGLLGANLIFPGDFDQCLSVITNQTFDTKYCSTGILLSELDLYTLPEPVTFYIGLCVPDTCDEQRLQGVIQMALSDLENTTANVISCDCKKETNPLSTLAIIIICFCSLLVSIIIAATLYDIFYINGLWHRILARSEINTVLLDEESDTGVLTFANRSTESSYEPPINMIQIPTKFEKLPAKLLLSFSLYTNVPKLLSTKHRDGNISCINGIKFISMTWVIFGHSGLLGIPVQRDVKTFIEDKMYSRWTSMVISNAFMAVDTFFVLSGCLMTYLVMKQLRESRLSGRFFAKFYFHRIWRLTPTYMLILVTYVALFKYISNGPFWPDHGFEKNDCKDTWWTNLLYINNLVRTGDMCMAWSWYLSNDMQFYWISPLVFLPLYFFGRKAYVVPVLFLLGTATVSGVLSSQNNLPASVDFFAGKGAPYFSVYYLKPYTRIGPYIVGMMTGYLLYRCKCRAKMSKVVALVGWMLATAIGLAVVYGLFENTNGHPVTTEVAAIYNALHKIAWGVSVSWVIFACATGYGGFANTLLSWRFFVPLSKLTLCAYLVHPMVLYFYYYSQRSLFHVDDINYSFLFAGSLTLTYAVAFLTSLAYESPILQLETVLRSHKWSRELTQSSNALPIVT